MNKKAGLVIVILVLVLSGFAAYRIVNTPKPKPGDIVASFTSCGCGGCGGSLRVENIKNTSQGKAEFNRLKKELAEPPSPEACMAVGCSICTEYRLIGV